MCKGEEQENDHLLYYLLLLYCHLEIFLTLTRWHQLYVKAANSYILELVNWKSLSYLYKSWLGSIMNKVYHNSFPEQVTTLLKFIRINENKNNLRRLNASSQVRYNLNPGGNSVRYRVPIIWNSIQLLCDTTPHKEDVNMPQEYYTDFNSTKKLVIGSKETDFLCF